MTGDELNEISFFGFPFFHSHHYVWNLYIKHEIEMKLCALQIP